MGEKICISKSVNKEEKLRLLMYRCSKMLSTEGFSENQEPCI